MLLRSLLPALITALGLGCAAAPPPPEALALAPISPEERARHTRLYETDDESAVLAACVAVLTAHGFSAEAQDYALGVIVGAKDTHAGRARSRLRASLATRPAGEFGLQTQLRVTFQRLAYNARGRELRREAVREPGEYAGFFAEVERELALANIQAGPK
ncbi:MAG: hypothetical protein FJ091_18305 [Deltaproteobacteria bacterium]|nr:hypothetical protein [Deltaproteobacteria bacterium]